jgi:hypothetical protein
VFCYGFARYGDDLGGGGEVLAVNLLNQSLKSVIMVLMANKIAPPGPSLLSNATVESKRRISTEQLYHL